MASAVSRDIIFEKFLRWQRDDSATVSEGLEILNEYLGTHAITIICAQAGSNFPTYFNAVPALQISPEETYNLLSKHLSEDGKFADTYCVQGSTFNTLSFIFPTQIKNEPIAITLWSKNKLQLDDATKIFMEMAVEACRLRVSAKFIREFKLPSTITEAFDAMDDGFIIYDKDQQIVAFNKKQKELFPSVSGTLTIGANYEAILRKQLAARQLPIAPDEEEEWVSRRTQQLKTHRHTEEQKFDSGKTIRLTNYQTASGGTIAARTDITELVEARQKAIENEQLFRALLIGAPIPLIIITGAEIVYANSYAEDLFDAKNKGLQNSDVRDLYVNQEHRHALMSRLEEDGYLREDTLKVKTFNGTEKTVILSANTITYKGNPSYFVSIMDISNMISAQEALEQSEQQYKALNELIPDALVLQVDGEIALVNESAVSTFRVSSTEELIGSSSIDLVAPHEREKMLEFREKVLISGKPEQINTQYQRRDGDIFHVELFGQCINWNGRQGTLNFIRDITTRLEYERELVRKEREMSLAQSIGKFGHWRANLEKQEVQWSQELYNIHGEPFSEEPITAEKASSFVIKEDLPPIYEAFNQLSATGQSQKISMRITRGDNEIRFLESAMHPEFDAIGNVQSVFGVTQDLTERRELEERLRQSQKMEAVGQLTGGIAHDFNNLLAVIQGNAELMAEMLSSDDEDKRARIDVILSATQRGADLTKSMLAFGRTQALNPSVINLNDNVQNMLKVLDRTIEENISITLDTDENLWDCFADPSQVENAVLNLTLNSRDAMPKGGEIILQTKNVRLTGKEFRQSEQKLEGEYVSLSITDTGSGIANDKLEHVFEPFFTTKEVGKGTGLGLSMVYGFISQSNGHIDIKSTVGKGTSVSIYLPKSGT